MGDKLGGQMYLFTGVFVVCAKFGYESFKVFQHYQVLVYLVCCKKRKKVRRLYDLIPRLD